MADARAAEAPTEAPHTGEGEATSSPARGNDAVLPTDICTAKVTQCVSSGNSSIYKYKESLSLNDL